MKREKKKERIEYIFRWPMDNNKKKSRSTYINTKEKNKRGKEEKTIQ